MPFRAHTRRTIATSSTSTTSSTRPNSNSKKTIFEIRYGIYFSTKKNIIIQEGRANSTIEIELK